MSNETLTIDGLSNEGIAYCEAQGLSKCFAAYATHTGAGSIESIGFNPNSGYVYIALENGVTICSSMGQEVEYLKVDYETGEESFFDDYEEAVEYDLGEEE